jgi:hypothetical protein
VFGLGDRALARGALHDSDRARLRLARAWQAQGELGLALALAQEALAGDPLACARERWLALAAQLEGGGETGAPSVAEGAVEPEPGPDSDDRSCVGA